MTEDTNKRPKPVVLIILDGWGVSQPYAGNAIVSANTLAIDDYISKYPTMTLGAAGEDVGLLPDETGNSYIGHLNLGLGRIVYQDLPRINKHIKDETFDSQETLVKAIAHVKNHNSKLHFIGLCSNGAVHSSIDHLYALIAMAKKAGLDKVYTHAILDGVDTASDSGEQTIARLEEYIGEIGVGHIASLCGRYFAMDSDNNWDRTFKTFNALTKGIGRKADDAIGAIKNSYKGKIYDEEVQPTVIFKDGKALAMIEDGDAVVFFNFRSDGARQLTKAFITDEVDSFKKIGKIKNLFFSTFTQYEEKLETEVVFPILKAEATLGIQIADAGLTQLRIAETEKYAHVTYLFNGENEQKSKGEEQVLIPSKLVSNYADEPEMSAVEVSKKVVESISDNKYDFILVNFANADMLGHTGNMEATIKAIECLDAQVEKIVNSVLVKDGVVMITSDHGNVEEMFNMQTGQGDKEHTTNPVPFILIGNEYDGRQMGWQDIVGDDLSTAQTQGRLADVAPTVLKILGIKKPKQMTGKSLL